MYNLYIKLKNDDFYQVLKTKNFNKSFCKTELSFFEKNEFIERKINKKYFIQILSKKTYKKINKNSTIQFQTCHFEDLKCL